MALGSAMAPELTLFRLIGGEKRCRTLGFRGEIGGMASPGQYSHIRRNGRLCSEVGVWAVGRHYVGAESAVGPRLSVSRYHGIMVMQPYWRERSKQGEQGIDRVRVGQDTGTGWVGSRAAKGIALAAGEPRPPSERGHRGSPRKPRPPGGNAARDSPARWPLPRGLRDIEERVACSIA